MVKNWDVCEFLKITESNDIFYFKKVGPLVTSKWLSVKYFINVIRFMTRSFTLPLVIFYRDTYLKWKITPYSPHFISGKFL